MDIGLIDVDGHGKFPNLALMKIARYHKQKGDNVSWYNQFDSYDKVYMSKVFTHTADYPYIITNAKEIEKGGTGYDIYKTLPDEIDRLQPDYTIYPFIDKKTAYGFLTRGCIRKCKWCVVPKKEGYIHPYMDVDEIAIEGRTKLILMDNNLIASGDYAIEQFNKIRHGGYRIDLNQGNDARLITDEWAKTMATTKWIDSTIRFGCDTPKQVEDCDHAIELIRHYGFKGKFLLYTMIYGDIDECFDRINHWRAEKYKKKVRCQGQPELDFNTHRQNIPQWQKYLANWCNERWVYFTTEFKDFSPRKGFTCGEYFD